MESFFRVVNLKASIDGNLILKGLSLEVNKGEIHGIMGPNGSGKTTFSNVIMGNPKYEVVGGDILFKGESVLDMSTDERAKRGIFLAFQYSEEVPGVSFMNFLRLAYNSVNSYRYSDFVPPKPLEFRNLVKSKMALLDMDDSLFNRYLNEGFSGGERKRAEILQMLLLDPELVIMDETDSGLDIDALKVVSRGVMEFKNERNSFVVITHYSRILKYIKPDFVHVMIDGRIVKTGDHTLADRIEDNGYDWILKEVSYGV